MTETTENTANLPYKNPELSTEERIANLLGRMTLEEKVGQMMQLDARSGDLDDLIVNKHVGSILHTSPSDLPKAVETVNTKTRLGIPLVIGDDCIHGYSFWPGATIFPEQLGMATTWDSEKVQAAGRATAEEVSATGVHWTFSPVLCIARDTRWGRVGETFGEDPYLIGEMASSIVKGYQGGAKAGEPLAKDAILACAKHFAGYSETQGGRDASEADLSHRKLESWFLPPFERVAKEGCGTFMLGYESIEGVPVTFNKWLLSDKLRGAWNYQGTLITDWDNVGRSVWEQKVKPDYVQAAADAVRSGNDLVMTTPKFYEGAIEAVKTGLLDESLIDAAVARILALKFRLGLFEDPRLPDQERIDAVIGSEKHQQLNLEVAREAVALLKNNGSLPFNAAGAKRIAVVGPLADDAQTQLGDWAGSSGQINWMPGGHPREMITTVLDGFKQLAPKGCEVVYSRGANIVDLVPDPEGEFYPDGQPRPKIGVSAKLDRALLDEAVENARQSDLIVAVVGDVIQAIGEGCSTATLELLGGQNALIDALSNVARETGKPFVVVLVSSKPQILPASVIGTNGVIVDETPAEGTSALLWAPSPGMKGGQAIAEIILGETEPSGRLPITFPRHAGQLPVYYNQIRGQHGNRYADLTQDPAFAFGEGLSYTTFEYGEPTVTNVPESGAFGETDTVHAEITLTNTGDRKGTEVVQLYIGDIVTSYSWTDRELKAFQRVELEPGESETVAFDIPVSDCTIVDSEANRIVEPGEFEVLIGHSSRREDLKRTTFTVA
ncbi:glycoside hydrolase family 3 N-terminal domain-containing protein [Bifidobacterium pseudocatenulatum]|uniref:glycoside hydrolase family 3 N-terminal domain-containing protein n=1 Tax=Bifidobacterium pseudocatenulatum TaxID=28026 RepID=UPI00189B46DE|nr:glycoside hydrolase family 3 N-terminal domain-containing protein [Bifidobacterium pseudocatenulatum]MDB6518090.1 glycoside hydrolase family 3 C-terminal domain-containing protein [Bifidobacterium pseudocatenulatum]MDB6522048.1 glycoside hydrolase family 3 C-terminal domain-containing protein [Bifidobacterium pseudocatenulatum]MDB6523818.1 glycoside hydrolase family 3 C-terminal domain-containing protein [Bifidobacterium pseudocatenulatum]MDB6525116.1 glycoside hydrolase family 3 C-terminal 